MDQNNSRIINEIRHGEKISANAEKIWGHAKKSGQARVKRRIDLMKKLGMIRTGSRLIELGCGTGEFTKHLAETGSDILAIDISPDLLGIARKKIYDKPNVKFEICDIEKMENIPDDNFSCAVGNSILHHVDYIGCLKHLLIKLRAGGRIIFSEPNMMNPQIAAQKNIPWLKRILGDSPDEIAFFRWKLARELIDLGYKNVEVKNFDFLHPALPDFLAKIMERPLCRLEKIPVIKEISGSLLIYAE